MPAEVVLRILQGVAVAVDGYEFAGSASRDGPTGVPGACAPPASSLPAPPWPPRAKIPAPFATVHALRLICEADSRMMWPPEPPPEPPPMRWMPMPEAKFSPPPPQPPPASILPLAPSVMSPRDMIRIEPPPPPPPQPFSSPWQVNGVVGKLFVVQLFPPPPPPEPAQGVESSPCTTTPGIELAMFITLTP